MTALLAFEWLKFARRWTPRLLLILMSGMTLLGFLALSGNADERGDLFLPRGWLATLSFSAFFAPFIWPLLGGTWAGNEYGWGTIRAILTRRPSRIQHALAALVVLFVGVALAVLGLLVAGTVAGLIVSLLRGHELMTSGVWTSAFLGTLITGALTAWYVGAFYVLLAYAAATVTRSAAGGVGIGLAATLAQYILRSMLTGLGTQSRDFAQHFPIVYANSMITRVVGPQLLPGTSLATLRPYEPGVSESFVALTIYGAICLVVTLVAVRTRDVTA